MTRRRGRIEALFEAIRQNDGGDLDDVEGEYCGTKGCKVETFNAYLTVLIKWKRIVIEEIPTIHGSMRRVWTSSGYEAQREENEKLLMQKEVAITQVNNLDAYDTSKE